MSVSATPDFRDRVYSLFVKEKTDVLRRQDEWYERLQFKRPRAILRDRLLQDLPCTSSLCKCTSGRKLLALSGVNNDAIDRLEATANWWLLRVCTERPPRWKGVLWRTVCAIVEPEIALDNFGEAVRDAAAGTTFDVGHTRPGCGMVVPEGTFDITRDDSESTAIAAIEGAFGEVPTGCRRLYHGTTAAKATAFLVQGADVLHVEREPHDFGEAFYTTPQISVAFRFAVDTSDHGFTSTKPDTPGKVHDDPAILVLDVKETKMAELEWDFAKGSEEDWCTFVHNSLFGGHGDLPSHLALIRSTDCPKGNVISGAMCCNGVDVTDDLGRSTLPASSWELQTAFRSGRGMKLISPGHPSTGVMAVYVAREKHTKPY